jgi:hypothetical protein
MKNITWRLITVRFKKEINIVVENNFTTLLKKRIDTTVYRVLSLPKTHSDH